MENINDSELLSLLADPESRNQAFNTIVKKYSKQLYFHVRRMVIDHDDADDIIQDSFIKAYTKIENFRSESSIYTWLYKIATNTTLNFLAKKRRDQ